MSERYWREVEAAVENEKLYPEHRKLESLGDRNQIVGDFLLWLSEHGYSICRYEEHWDNGEPLFVDSRTMEKSDGGFGFLHEIKNPKHESRPAGWFPTAKSPYPEAWLAEYFGIDQEKLDDEKRAMIERCRELNERGKKNEAT